MSVSKRPKLAVWKFSSCDGCQLSLLACEDELLEVAETVEIAFFLEATRVEIAGPYDISLVEGSISTPHDIKRIQKVRRQSKTLITIGACATSGGIQALRNINDSDEFVQTVYARPEFISTLETSTPISDHVKVDYELRGCPVDKSQLLEVLNAAVNGRKPEVSDHSQCMECKMNHTVCVMVAKGMPCLGPVTHAGCGSICPSYNRGCYGCFGPKDSANPPALSAKLLEQGMSLEQVKQFYRSFNTNAEDFRKESERLEAFNG